MTRTISLLSVVVLVLAACASQNPVTQPVPATETLIVPITGATETAPPTEEIPPTETATEELTAEPAIPTNAADCTNNASFVNDVTIPDNTAIMGGETFIKTWRVLNTGTCIWTSDYTLTYYSEEQMGAPASTPLGLTRPGETLDISIALTAPNTIGTHRGNFVIKNPKGLIMKINSDSRLWVVIKVTGLAAPTVTAMPTPTTAANTGASPAEACAYTTDALKIQEAITAVNVYRGQFNMAAYPVSAQLSSAAQAHAVDMACKQLFGHRGSDGSTPATRVAASGYTAAYVSENVYGSYPPLSGEGVVNWFINDQTDPNHRLNLVSDTYTAIGVGYAFFNNYGYYVIVFATP